METKRISLDLSEKDYAEMERLMAFAAAASQLDAQRSPGVASSKGRRRKNLSAAVGNHDRNAPTGSQLCEVPER